jgi:AraC family transcriptional regulator, regulatory protein of adaptative response / methylated-DNA-[protein]-cysteine methyltransferase
MTTTVDTISYATSACGLGRVLVARGDAGVCAILIGADNDELLADLAARFPKAKLVANAAAVRDDVTKVVRFVDNEIPVGTTITYTELAHSIGAPNSVRAVASACASNPVALAVPCHRVVGSNSDLTGYYWGVERKRELLEKEAVA